MSISKNHKKGRPHSEWKKRQNLERKRQREKDEQRSYLRGAKMARKRLKDLGLRGFLNTLRKRRGNRG